MAEQIKFGDKLFLKGETVILDNGTSHGELKSNNGTIWIKGDLLVDGTVDTVNTQTINLADNKILINSNHTGVPTHDGSLTINRGTSDDAVIQWNESTDKWEAKVGTTYATVKADTFEGNVTGNLTGNSTGMHFGGVDTQGQDIIGSGTNDFATALIWNGSINDTTIGAITPSTGAFTTITGALTGTVSSIANHDTDDLSEGSTNLYYTQARVDARYATLHANANADTLDNQDGTYYLDYTNFTNTPTTITSLANHSIDALSDVDTTTTPPATGQILKWTGSIWVPSTDSDTIYTSFNTDFDTRFATKSTTNITEGANLYYTDVRSRASISATGSLSYNSGTGVISYTQGNTDTIAEGSTNLYYTDARADARINAASLGDLTNVNTVAPSSGQVLKWTGSEWAPDTDSGHTTTDTLTEGSTNLYYTDARSRGAISVSGDLSYNSSTGVISSSGLASSTTDDLAEGSTNLYYTAARDTAQFNTDFASKSTTDLSEGTNLYYTTARANTDFDTRLTTKDTDDLAEGSTNLYYTDARTRAVSIENIVEDTTPQLGGTLDLNTFDLTTTDPTVSLTTTLTATTTQGTVAASSETNLSNTTVAFLDDTGNISTATSAYTTLSSTEIDNLGFKGDISLTYFGSAAPTSNFVWRDVSDSAEQNDMLTVYAPTPDEYTFTLDHETLWQIDSTDNDVYFKQYAYGEMTVTSATTLSGSTIQLRDANGFYIDKEHVIVSSLGGTSYKIVFWTHDVSVGDVIDVIAASAQTAIFEWGTSTYSETGLTMSAESFSLQSSTNDIFAMGDLEFTLGNVTGEVVGTLIYDDPTNNTIISGLTTVTIDGTGYQAAHTITEVPIVMTGNVGTSNELSIAVGSATDARLWLMDSSGNLIYKFPAADGTANQVMKTDGSGDISWATQNTDDVTEGSTNLYYTDARWNTKMTAASTSDLSEGTNLYYTDGRADARAQLKIDALVGGASAAFDTLVEIQNAMATDTELTSAISGLNHDTLSGFVANEHIDWTADQGATNIHAGNYTNTTYTSSDFTHNSLSGVVANEHIDWTTASAGTIDPSNYVNTGNTTYTAGTGLTLVGTEFRNTAQDQTVSLTGTGATTVTGTYPNFTIDSTNTTTSITGNIIPATDNTYDLGSTAIKYANIYGHSVHATYADLAERYATDVPYEEGTVVVFGGEAEITTTSEPGDVSVAGVISTNPAVRMNAEAGNSQTHPYVALRGRVPCKMIGPVSKGDLIVTADNESGYAQSIGKNDAGRSVFAKSIETDLTEGKKLIEVVII